MSRGLTSRLRVATLAAEGASAKIRSLLSSLSLPSRQQAPLVNWGAHTSQWFTQIWSLRMTSKAPENTYPHTYMISITEKTPEIGWLFHGFQKIIFHGIMITQSCPRGTIDRRPESFNRNSTRDWKRWCSSRSFPTPKPLTCRQAPPLARASRLFKPDSPFLPEQMPSTQLSDGAGPPNLPSWNHTLSFLPGLVWFLKLEDYKLCLKLYALSLLINVTDKIT